ncbi:MAG: DUF5522 domain-containing protein [Cytophagales bacterium]
MKISKKGGDSQRQDYYMDNGLMVFTEHFHLRRGYCCKNKCRHCPYKTRTKNKSTVNSYSLQQKGS